MANRSQTRDFLTTRRPKFTPEQAGREEVALLAGASVDYDTP
jgi:hypothetical protein